MEGSKYQDCPRIGGRLSRMSANSVAAAPRRQNRTPATARVTMLNATSLVLIRLLTPNQIAHYASREPINGACHGNLLIRQYFVSNGRNLLLTIIEKLPNWAVPSHIWAIFGSGSARALRIHSTRVPRESAPAGRSESGGDADVADQIGRVAVEPDIGTNVELHRGPR